jgi:hypothetical protein
VDGDLLVVKTLQRAKLWEVQTPQCIRPQLLREGFELVRSQGLEVTDDVSIIEAMGRPVKITAGAYTNIKVSAAGPGGGGGACRRFRRWCLVAEVRSRWHAGCRAACGGLWREPGQPGAVACARVPRRARRPAALPASSQARARARCHPPQVTTPDDMSIAEKFLDEQQAKVAA